MESESYFLLLLFDILSDSTLRAILWFFYSLSPVVLLCFVSFLIPPRTRRLGISVLLISTIGAVFLTVLFHYSYVMRIWKMHESAIWFLDTAAFSSGFALTGVLYLVIYGMYRFALLGLKRGVKGGLHCPASLR